MFGDKAMGWWMMMVVIVVMGRGVVGVVIEENNGDVVETLIHSSDYKSTWLSSAAGFTDGLQSSCKLADASSFPALSGEGIAMARTDFGPKGLNPPHKHPNVTEVLFVVQGTLLVGFVDTINNTLFQQTLDAGDLFVFPHDHVHYQLNMDINKPAMAISALNSATPAFSQIAANSINS